MLGGSPSAPPSENITNVLRWMLNPTDQTFWASLAIVSGLQSLILHLEQEVRILSSTKHDKTLIAGSGSATGNI